MAGAKVAVIYRNDDAYSQGIRDTFVKEAEAKGAFEIVSETTFTDSDRHRLLRAAHRRQERRR